MKKIGYMRVSTEEQNLERQTQELEKYKLDDIIYDKSSGKNINENLITLLDNLNAGDELIVLSLDRLGRSLSNNIQIIEDLKQRGIRFRSIKENLIIDNQDNHMNDFIFKIFSSVAELERALIKDRQREGIANRKKKVGKAYNKQAEHRTKMLKNKTFRSDIKHKQRKYVMENWNISQSTYYNYKKLIK